MIERLDSMQMARFAAQGVLRFDGRVPDAVNDQFMDEAGRLETPASGEDPETLLERHRASMRANRIPEVPAGTPLLQAYAPETALGRLVRLPWVRGAIESLVGPGSLLDHHFLHVTYPPRYRGGRPGVSQNTHQDSTIDPRQAFDIQLMYFPHEVTAAMGGTRYVPGTHLRIVSEAAIGRYQNILGQQHVVCPAGTLLFTHHGLWHGGGANRSDSVRYMFKIRLNPTVRQRRLWDTSDLTPADHAQQPIFHVKRRRSPEHLHAILTAPAPWFENDSGRLEYLNRIRFWRFLLGDESFDADYWLTRVENEPTARALGGAAPTP